MESVLIVEDDPDIRELIVDLLECDGWSAHGAMHGRDALEQLEAGLVPDVILMDMMMPVMDGWTLQRTLAQDARWARIPIIVLSASLPPNDMPGFGTFLPKPVDIDHLQRTLRRVIAGESASRGTG